MISSLFALEPSFTEQLACNSCSHSTSSTYPLVGLNNLTFSNDLSNLEKAVMGNFPEKLSCSRCKNDVECKREFGPHMFIEVSVILNDFKHSCTAKYLHLLLDVFQIPTYISLTGSSDYGHRIERKLGEIPISIMDNTYVLLAAFLYSGGISGADIGHYITGIKVNDKWEIYDDLKTKPEEVSPNKAVTIHALLYLKR